MTHARTGDCQSARRYLAGNEKLESKIRKLEQRVEVQSQAILTEQDSMMKRLQESEVSEADMIHYILTSSAKKPRKAKLPEYSASDNDLAPTDDYMPPMENNENMDLNQSAQAPLTPSKADLKRTLNSRIMVRHRIAVIVVCANVLTAKCL